MDHEQFYQLMSVLIRIADALDGINGVQAEALRVLKAEPEESEEA